MVNEVDNLIIIITCLSVLQCQEIFSFWGIKITRLSLYSYITHLNKFCVMFIVSFSLFVAGLIHANHGGKIIEYLLQQLKNATSDVSFTSA